MNQLSKEEIKERIGGWTFNQYYHGGSRIYIDNESDGRILLVDTYYDADFAKYINECALKYFQEPTDSRYELSVYERCKEIFDSNLTWEEKYNSIFDIGSSSGIQFQWLNMDTTYEEDVTNYMKGFEEYLNNSGD